MSVKYTGDGSQYVPGLPARDIDDDEWALLSKEQQKFATATGLYEAEAAKPKPKPDGP